MRDVLLDFIDRMLRVLLLTSTINFMARSCETKVLIALIISLLFLCVFMLTRPYRSAAHHHAQIAAMLIPVLSLAYAAAGGWERAETTLAARTSAQAADDADKGYDRVALVVLHVVLASPVFLGGIFTLGSLLVFYVSAPSHQQRDLSPAASLREKVKSVDQRAMNLLPQKQKRGKRKGRQRRRRARRRRLRRKKAKAEAKAAAAKADAEAAKEKETSSWSSSSWSSSQQSSWSSWSSASMHSADEGKNGGDTPAEEAAHVSVVPDAGGGRDGDEPRSGRARASTELLRPLKRSSARVHQSLSMPIMRSLAHPSSRRGSVHGGQAAAARSPSRTTRKAPTARAPRSTAAAAYDDDGAPQQRRSQGHVRRQESVERMRSTLDAQRERGEGRDPSKPERTKGKGKSGSSKKKKKKKHQRKMSHDQRQRLKLRRKQNRARRKTATNVASQQQPPRRSGTVRRLSVLVEEGGLLHSQGPPQQQQQRRQQRSSLARITSMRSRALQWEHRAQQGQEHVRAGGTGFERTLGLKTEEEMEVEDEFRQVADMVELGRVKPPEGVYGYY